MSTSVLNPFRDGEILRLAPTTPPQKEIFSSAIYSDAANAAFNEVLRIRIDRPIDVDRMRASLNALVDRHDILRSTFASSGDRLCLHDSTFVLRVSDHSENDDATLASARELIEKRLVITPMNLGEGPLFNAELFREPAADVLYLQAHHIVCDGFSLGLIVQEIEQLYEAGVEAGDTAPSFFDYAEQHAAAQIANRDRDYWAKQFPDAPPLMDWPMEKAYPVERAFQAARIDMELGSGLDGEVRQAARQAQCSALHWMLASYFALLHRLSGQTDLCVGLPVAGQAASSRLQQVGHMVQLLPIRVEVDPSAGLGVLARQVRDKVLDATEHPNFTFAELLENLRPERNRAPLISTSFNRDQTMPEIGFGGARAEIFCLPRVSESFELAVNVVPEKDCLRIEATYSTGLFSENMVRGWMDTWCRLMAGAASAPDVAVAELPLNGSIALGELARPCDAFTRGTFLSDFLEQTAQAPQFGAVRFAGRDTSYAELEAGSRRVALRLRGKGVSAGDVVALCVDRRAEMLVGLLGVMRAGATLLPLDPNWPPERLAYMLEDSGARCLLTDVSTPTRLSAASMLSIDEVCNGGSDDGELPEVAPDSTAYLLYTSGSTGQPKGVAVPHSALANLLQSVCNRPGITAGDRLLAVTTLSFDIAFLELLAPLTVGGTVVIAAAQEAQDSERLATLISAEDITVMQATPSTWYALANGPWKDCGREPRSLRALCGGEPLRPSLAAALLPHVDELWNMYGPTETTIWSSCKRVRSDDGIITIGTPIARTSLLVLDEKQQVVPAGVPGELYIGGAGLSQGYWKRPELNAEKFIVHEQFGPLYRTGDRARLTSHAEVVCLGRVDDQVKLRGFRIELGEVEKAIEACSGIARAGCAIWDAGEGDRRLFASCIAKDETADTISIRRELRRQLPAYMIPQHFLFVDELPVGSNGKVDRRQLAPPAEVTQSVLASVAPLSQREAELAQLWNKALKSECEIRPQDTFFSIGGHSLLSLQVARDIKQRFAVTVTPADLVTKDLRQLARHLDEQSGALSTVASAEAVPVKGSQRRLASAEQQRIQKMRVRNAAATRHHLPAAWRISGNIRKQEFLAACEQVLNRQSALRSCLIESNGEIELSTLPLKPDSWVEWIDLLGSDVDAPRTGVTGWDIALRCAEEPFALWGGPLCRIRMIATGANEYLLTLTAHQLVFDGWSFDLFLHELSGAYEALVSSQPSSLNGLPCGFADAVQRMELVAPEEYRGVQLRQRLSSAKLPRGIAKSGPVQFHRFTRQMDCSGLNGLEFSASRANVRLHVLLLAGLAATARSVMDTDSLLLGLPVARREDPEVAGLIGNFLDVLPLRFDKLDPDFVDVLHSVDAMLEAEMRQPRLSLAGITDDPDCLGRIPLSFSYQDVRRRSTQFLQARLEQLDLPRNETEFPVEVWLRQNHQGLDLFMDCDLGRVDEELARGLFEAYGNALENIAAGKPPVEVSGRAALSRPSFLTRWKRQMAS